MKTNKQLAQLYQITNKQQNLTDFIYSIYNRTLSMFAYTGLPDTVDRAVLEKHLQLYGYVVFFKYNNKLYFTKAGLTGNEKSPYNEPTEAFSHVDDLELCPQMHQSVAGRSAGESNDTLDPGPYLHQSLEAF